MKKIYELFSIQQHKGCYLGIEVELENEHGTIAYEVELDNGLEVMVDPNDGSILGTEQDDD